eukprot:3158513-Prymnesium_polylepis.1
MDDGGARLHPRPVPHHVAQEGAQPVRRKPRRRRAHEPRVPHAARLGERGEHIEGGQARQRRCSPAVEQLRAVVTRAAHGTARRGHGRQHGGRQRRAGGEDCLGQAAAAAPDELGHGVLLVYCHLDAVVAQAGCERAPQPVSWLSAVGARLGKAEGALHVAPRTCAQAAAHVHRDGRVAHDEEPASVGDGALAIAGARVQAVVVVALRDRTHAVAVALPCLRKQ